MTFKVKDITFQFDFRAQIWHKTWLSECPLRYRAMCPITALKDLMRKQRFKKGFLKKCRRENSLSLYLKLLAGDDTTVYPHALRIRDRTWYLSNNLDKQFVNFRGAWACPEASARYYRASPTAVFRLITTEDAKNALRTYLPVFV